MKLSRRAFLRSFGALAAAGAGSLGWSRLSAFAAKTGAGFLLILGRLWYLPVLEGSQLRELSERNRSRVLPTRAPRGMLYDRNGLPLVENRPSFTLSVIPREVEDPRTVLARGEVRKVIETKEALWALLSSVLPTVNALLNGTSAVTLRYFAGFTPFAGQGRVRPVYFTILISHTILAATTPPLALTLLYRAFREQFAKHRRLARWTLPVWFYVSVTGVIVYLMLYQFYPLR